MEVPCLIGLDLRCLVGGNWCRMFDRRKWAYSLEGMEVPCLIGLDLRCLVGGNWCRMFDRRKWADSRKEWKYRVG